MNQKQFDSTIRLLQILRPKLRQFGKKHPLYSILKKRLQKLGEIPGERLDQLLLLWTQARPVPVRKHRFE